MTAFRGLGKKALCAKNQKSSANWITFRHPPPPTLPKTKAEIEANLTQTKNSFNCCVTGRRTEHSHRQCLQNDLHPPVQRIKNHQQTGLLLDTEYLPPPPAPPNKSRNRGKRNRKKNGFNCCVTGRRTEHNHRQCLPNGLRPPERSPHHLPSADRGAGG